jgi:hypothetical protein
MPRFPIGPNAVFVPRDSNFRRLSRNEWAYSQKNSCGLSVVVLEKTASLGALAKLSGWRSLTGACLAPRTSLFRHV